MTIPTFRQAGQPAAGALRHELTDGAAAAKPVLPPVPVSRPAAGGAPAKAIAKPAKAGTSSGKKE